MHYLPLGARLNKGILMVTQLNQGFSCPVPYLDKICGAPNRTRTCDTAVNSLLLVNIYYFSCVY